MPEPLDPTRILLSLENEGPMPVHLRLVAQTRHDGHAAPGLHLLIDHGGYDVEQLDLTPTEARELIRALQIAIAESESSFIEALVRHGVHVPN